MKISNKPQPVSAFLTTVEMPAPAFGPTLARVNDKAFAPGIDQESFETAVSIRSGIRNKLDYPAATAIYQGFAERDLKTNGPPTSSLFALQLKTMANTSPPPRTTVVEVPRQLHDVDANASRASLGGRIGAMAQIDPATVNRGSHRAYIEAGERFVAAQGAAPTTDAGFRKLHRQLVSSSIFSQKEAEGYAYLLARVPTRDGVTSLAQMLRITNGADLPALQGVLDRRNFTNSSYDYGQINAPLHAPNIVLHEYGHHMLAHQPKVLEAAIAMQLERKGDDASTDAMVNDSWIPFDATYQEKFYRGDAALGFDRTKVVNAELLPVALQQFSTPAAMKHLHDVDPDLFHFALGVIRPDTGKASVEPRDG